MGETPDLLNNRYQKIRLIQSGSYGRVSLAHDSQTDSLVSLKEVPLSYSPVAHHEISILRTLGSHPNVCGLLDSFSTADSVVLVLQYCERDLYALRGEVSSHELFLIARQIAAAVDYCHSRGVYHRDLKPENILISDAGVVKLCDWGMATTHRISHQFNVGSEKYMAPEVFINNYNKELDLKKYDAKFVDYWSIGITLITVLFGHTPFKPVNGKLVDDSNFRKFVLCNEKSILFDVYPNLNLNGFEIFMNLLKINGYDDNLDSFEAKIQERNLDGFVKQLEANYKYGLTLDEEEDDIRLEIQPVKSVSHHKIDYSFKTNVTIMETEVEPLNWYDY